MLELNKLPFIVLFLLSLGFSKFTLGQESSEELDDIMTVVEIMPSFPGGEEALFKFIGDNVKYPETAKNHGIQGTVYASFIIEKNGIVSNPKIVKGIGAGCDDESIRVITLMPEWTPGVHMGKPVRVKYTLPFKYELKTDSTVQAKDTDSPSDNYEIFTIVEEMPEYPGGPKAMFKFISDNLQYPAEAEKNRVEGLVILSFEILSDGSLDKINVLKGIGSGCDKEAIRLVDSMPLWTPGLSQGKPIPVLYNLPIRFILNKRSKKKG